VLNAIGNTRYSQMSYFAI